MEKMATIICNINSCIFNYFYKQLSKRTEKGGEKEDRVMGSGNKNLVNISSDGTFR